MDEISLYNLPMNVTDERKKHTESISSCFCTDSRKIMLKTVSVC